MFGWTVIWPRPVWRLRMALLAALALLILLMMVRLALAQVVTNDPPGATVPVNVAPLWATITPYVVAILTAFGIWIKPMVDAWLTRHGLSILQDDFDQGLAHVPSLMTAVLARQAAQHGSVNVPVAVSTVATMVAQTVPGLLVRVPVATVEAFVEAKLHEGGHPAVTQAPAKA